MPHVSEIRLRVTQPLRQLPENKKADDEAQTNDQEQNSENGRHENPITVLGATRFTPDGAGAARDCGHST
jgi:hypothetical protein